MHFDGTVVYFFAFECLSFEFNRHTVSTNIQLKTTVTVTYYSTMALFVDSVRAATGPEARWDP